MTSPSTRPRITLVVAVTENHIIGKDGGLPWRLPDDLKHFKRVTLGKPVIMGRKTFDELFQRPLPGRPNLVVSRNLTQDDIDPKHQDAVTVHPSLESALAAATNLVRESDPPPHGQPPEICIIGGGTIYQAALTPNASGNTLADRVILTRIHAHIEGDTSFPQLDQTAWHLTRSEHHEADETHAHAFTFEWHDRVAQ